MKKNLLFILFLVISASVLSSCFASNKVTNTNNPGYHKVTPIEDFEYTLIKDNTAVSISRYIGTDQDVVIPSNIEGLPVEFINYSNSSSEIGAFEGKNIRSVVIPNSIIGIGNQAFKDSTELASVIIDSKSSLKWIGYKAFNGCVSIESIDFSLAGSMNLISGSAFEGCTKLSSVSLPDCITTISSYAFKDCTTLKEIILPKELETLESGAFMDCTSLKKISIPYKMDLLYATAPCPFPKLSLDEVIFENGREEIIGYACFQTASDSHVKIIIPDSVKKINTSSFLLNGSAEIEFLGNCPEIVGDSTEFPYISTGSDDLTIYYHQGTSGWETCPWNGVYQLKAIS